MACPDALVARDALQDLRVDAGGVEVRVRTPAHPPRAEEGAVGVQPHQRLLLRVGQRRQIVHDTAARIYGLE